MIAITAQAYKRHGAKGARAYTRVPIYGAPMVEIIDVTPAPEAPYLRMIVRFGRRLFGFDVRPGSYVYLAKDTLS